MPALPSQWPPHKVERAAKLWEMGRTQAQIAVEMNTTTRSVAGMIFRNRDKFPSREKNKGNRTPRPRKEKKKDTSGPILIEGRLEPLNNKWRVHRFKDVRAFFYLGMALTPKFTFAREGEYWIGHGVKARSVNHLYRWVNQHG